MQPPRDEQGYALVAAVASILVFAAIAVMVISATQRSVRTASAEIGRAKVQAAAEAGLALALHSLAGAARGATSVPLDGRPRQYRFDDADLTIAIEDERGKVPLNALDDDQARRLFEALGLTGERLDVATDSFLDWVDDDDDVRPNGAESPYYAAWAIRPRNGPLQSVPEVALIRGIDPSLARRMERFTTVHFGRGTFLPGRADPIAIRVMEDEDQAAIDIIERERVLAGQAPALTTDTSKGLTGHPFTIRVMARRPDGSATELRQIVLPTGRPDQPFVLAERY